MSNRDNYKNTFSNIRPSSESIERIMDMTKEKRKVAFISNLKKITVGALALVLLVGGSIFGVDYAQSKSIQNNPIGSIIIADASEPVGKASTNIGYRLYVADISNMNEKQIYDAKIELLKRAGISANTTHEINDGLKNQIRQNGNAICIAERGTTTFIPNNIENPENVESITISNNSDYANIIVSVEDDYYTEVKENVYVFDSKSVDTSRTCIEGHSVTVDGERYAKCRKITSEESTAYSYDSYYNKNSEFYMIPLNEEDPQAFYFDYDFTNEFYNALGKNPNMNFEDYKDTITLNIKFKDGNIAETVLEIGINEEGIVNAKCVSYDYGK